MTEIIKYIQDNESGYEKISEDIITFKHKDLSFVFVTDPQDTAYIRLIVILENNSNNQQKDIYERINEYNKEYKCAKISIENNNFWLSIEHFLYSRENIVEIFKRLIQILVLVTKDFKEKEEKHKQ